MKTSIMWYLQTVTLLLACSSALTLAAEPVQTQFGMSGDVEVDLIKANVDEGVLTMVFVYRNTGSEDIDLRYHVSNVYYLDKADGKKYHVLADTEGKWLAAPTTNDKHDYTRVLLDIPASGKKLAWFKFPAPPEASEKIDIVLPDALPFENVAPSR
jgi:hypothetical protein